MELTYARKRPGYWKTSPILSVSFFIENTAPGVIPTQEELIKAGRKDLVNAIQRSMVDGSQYLKDC